MRMFSNFNAAAMGIPRFINNSIKPWIYINFQSEEVMQTAMETTPTLNNRQLIWDSPDNVRNFCPRCSSPEHKAKDCDDIRSRGRKPTPKVLIDVYKKHGIVNAATKQADKQLHLQQQQQKNSNARSRSRSRPRPPPNVEFSVPSNSIDIPPNSYADALNKGSSGLNNSDHASGNRNNRQQTPPINNNTPPSRNISKDSLNEIYACMKQAEKRINDLTTRMDQWKCALDNIDSRFANIEKHLNINPPPVKNTNAQTQVTVPKSPPKQTTGQTQTTQIPARPVQNIRTQHNNNQTSPLNNYTPASSSADANNNNNKNNSPTVQGLANEFDTMQGDVSSLKTMMKNLTSMLQNALGQPQKSTPQDLN